MVGLLLSAAPAATASSSPAIGSTLAWIVGLGLICFVLWRQDAAIRQLRGEGVQAEEKETAPAMFDGLYGAHEASLLSRIVAAVRARPTTFVIGLGGVLGCVGVVQFSRASASATTRDELRVAEAAKLRVENDSLRALLAVRIAAAPSEAAPAVTTTAAAPAPTRARQPTGANVASRPAARERVARTQPTPVVTAAKLPPRPGVDAGVVLPLRPGVDAGAVLPPPAAPVSVPLIKP